MKAILLGAILSALSINAFAKDQTLICMMGDAADMDIKIEQLENKKEKLSVIVYEMDGITKTVFTNSNFENNSLSRTLSRGEFQGIVSTSDLDDMFGGAYLKAGMIHMEYNKSAKAFDVFFAAKGMVYTASCK